MESCQRNTVQEPSSKNYIDILLGVYYPQFHYQLKKSKRKMEIKLGGTHTGQPLTSTTQITKFTETFHVRGVEN